VKVIATFHGLLEPEEEDALILQKPVTVNPLVWRNIPQDLKTQNILILIL
jgi:hypothetical protein